MLLDLVAEPQKQRRTERRKHEPSLRPSVIPSLLACRRANQDAHAEVPGGLRFYETASVFAQDVSGGALKTVERRVLSLLADVAGAPLLDRGGR